MSIESAIEEIRQANEWDRQNEEKEEELFSRLKRAVFFLQA